MLGGNKSDLLNLNEEQYVCPAVSDMQVMNISRNAEQE